MNNSKVFQFINNTEYALEHIYRALGVYYRVLGENEKEIGKINDCNRMLSEKFIYEGQWSVHANASYANYMKKTNELLKMKNKVNECLSSKLERFLESNKVSLESMSYLAGLILQLAKQMLSIRYNCKPSISDVRKIGTQSIIEIIWEGRNHAMHWEEIEPKEKVKEMLQGLERDFIYDIKFGENNCLLILEALGWIDKESVIKDMKEIILSGS